jgi:response regulator NasT
MRVAMVATGGYLDKQLSRILISNGIKGDTVTSITRRVIDDYGIVVLSSNNEIPNLPVLIERLVLEQKVHVVFINKTSSIGQFYNVMNDMYFHLIQEYTCDVEFPLLVRTLEKIHNPYARLEKERDEYKDRLDTIQLTNKAKRILMNNGYTEEDAHQFIQKTAMDKRISKKRLVSLIIQNKIDI